MDDYSLTPRDAKRANQLARNLRNYSSSDTLKRNCVTSKNRSIHTSINVVRAAYSVLTGVSLPGNIQRSKRMARERTIHSPSGSKNLDLPSTNTLATNPPPEPPANSQFPFAELMNVDNALHYIADNKQREIYPDKSNSILPGEMPASSSTVKQLPGEPAAGISTVKQTLDYLDSHQDQLIQFVDADQVNLNNINNNCNEEPNDNTNCQLTGDLQTFIENHYDYWIAQNAPPENTMKCNSCSIPREILYSCFDCFNQSLFCSSCICKQHSHSHFHRISNYSLDCNHYQPTMLSQLGLITNLSHDDGSTCPNPGQTTQLHVYHINGIHLLTVPLCNCPNFNHLSRKLTTQRLMANRLFPQTWKDPISAYTFELLDTYNMLNLKSFINIKQACDTIIAITPEGLFRNYTSKESSGRMRDRFSVIIRLFRLMKSMQRTGARNYHSFLNIGVAGDCPICIIPGINVPVDWKSRQYPELLNQRIYMIDGNFRLQLRQQSSSLQHDPSLFGDSGFFAKVTMQNNYITYAESLELSGRKQKNKNKIRQDICSLRAGDQSRERPTEPYSVNGVFAAQCKHGYFIENGLCDLKKGERFSTLDVVTLQLLQNSFARGIPRVVFTYDNACHYHVNLHSRASENPYRPIGQEHLEKLRPSNGAALFRLNAFHAYSHNEDCSEKNSIRNTPMIGRISGEEVEVPWAILNNLQCSTREMGAGARRDCITTHMEWQNIQKIARMGKTLKEKLFDAYCTLREEKLIMEEVEQQLEHIKKGSVNNLSNLYFGSKNNGLRPAIGKEKLPSQRKIFTSLLREEANHYKKKKCAGLNHSLVRLAAGGLELEQKSEKLRHQKKRNFGWITNEQRHQDDITSYSDTVFSLFPLQTNDLFENEHAIALPSNFTELEVSDPDFTHFTSYELQLRVGYGHDLLQNLRTHICIGSTELRHRKDTRTSKEAESRAKSRGETQKQISQLAKSYADNWIHIQTLLKMLNLKENDSKILKQLHELHPTDLKYFTEWINDRGDFKDLSEGSLPWIWNLQKSGEVKESAEQLKIWEFEALKNTWFKMKSSLQRWKEEILLLQEEMSRLGAWYKYHTSLLSEELDSSKKDKYSKDRVTAGYFSLQSLRLYQLMGEWNRSTE